MGNFLVHISEPKCERAQLRGASGSSHIAATAAIEVEAEAEAAAARAANTGGKQTIALSTSVAWAGDVDVACQLLPSMSQYRHPDATMVSPVEKTTDDRASVLHDRTSGGGGKDQSHSPDPLAPCKPPSDALGDQGVPGATCLPSTMQAHTARNTEDDLFAPQGAPDDSRHPAWTRAGGWGPAQHLREANGKSAEPMTELKEKVPRSSAKYVLDW